MAIATERGGRIAARVVPRATNKEIGAFLRRFVHPDAVIMSDDDTATAKAAKGFHDHRTVVHSRHQYVVDDASAVF